MLPYSYPTQRSDLRLTKNDFPEGFTQTIGVAVKAVDLQKSIFAASASKMMEQAIETPALQKNVRNAVIHFRTTTVPLNVKTRGVLRIFAKRQRLTKSPIR